MTMYFKNVALLAKTEVTYGTDPVPTGTANAMLSKAVTIAPYLGNRVTRDLDRSTFGAQSEINTGPYVTVSFGIEYAASGTAGTAPKWGPLLLACGFSETVSAGTSVTYATVSTALKSCTLYFYMDGQQHKVIGARGNVSFNLSRGQIPTMNFTFTGKYTRPTAVANPALTVTGFQSPLAVTKANTPTFTLHGYAAYCEALTLDMGNNIVYRNLIGDESILLTDRNARGNVVIEAPALASKDYFSAMEAHAGVTLGAVNCVHGTTAGNILTLAGSYVQLGNVSMNNSDGVCTYAMDTVWTPSAGNDEVTLVAT
jgi:hypothetical protein